MGTNKCDIIHGIHKSVAGRVSGLCHRIGVRDDVVMTGGVAQNHGIVKALQEQLGHEIHTTPLTQYNGCLLYTSIAALERINADSFTLDAINSTLSGCGIKALAEETEKKGTVKVWFPNTVGVPEEFSQVESIILDIIPCHLLVEFYFRYLTWLECEAQGFTWRIVEDEKHHTWESLDVYKRQEQARRG